MGNNFVNGYQQVTTPYDELMALEPRGHRKAKYNNLVAKHGELFGENMDLKKQIQTMQERINTLSLTEEQVARRNNEIDLLKNKIVTLEESNHSLRCELLHVLRAMSNMTDAMRERFDPEIPPF